MMADQPLSLNPESVENVTRNALPLNTGGLICPENCPRYFDWSGTLLANTYNNDIINNNCRLSLTYNDQNMFQMSLK